MDAGAAGGGVDEDAGEGSWVVGEAGALVGVEDVAEGGVGVAGGDCGEAGGGQQWAQATGKGEGEVFLGEVVGDVGADVVSTVGGVEDDDGSAEGGGLSLEGCRDEAAEEQGCGTEEGLGAALVHGCSIVNGLR